MIDVSVRNTKSARKIANYNLIILSYCPINRYGYLHKYLIYELTGADPSVDFENRQKYCNGQNFTVLPNISMSIETFLQRKLRTKLS